MIGDPIDVTQLQIVCSFCQTIIGNPGLSVGSVRDTVVKHIKTCTQHALYKKLKIADIAEELVARGVNDAIMERLTKAVGAR